MKKLFNNKLFLKVVNNLKIIPMLYKTKYILFWLRRYGAGAKIPHYGSGSPK